MKRKEEGSEEVTAGQAFMAGNMKRSGQPSKKTGVCNYCGKMGHWIAECYSRIQDNADRQRANVAHNQNESSNDFFFAVRKKINYSVNNSAWLIDSGATKHMSFSKWFMTN